MTAEPVLITGNVVLPDRILEQGGLLIRDGRIAAIGRAEDVRRQAGANVTFVEHDGYLAPGYVDMHVHGGGGADFMDGTSEAFETALATHLRHGTTSIVPTTTVARYDQVLRMLDFCRTYQSRTGVTRAHANPAIVPRQSRGLPEDSLVRLPRVLGAHLYGSHFRYEARGCHSAGPLRPPTESETAAILERADAILTATIAPELPEAEPFARGAHKHGIRFNVGHSLATFKQVQASIEWGVRHVDHLYCAMSDKTKLRAQQAYPMRGGLLEATLYFDELTTEVIADGKHLSADLLMLAYKLKGPHRLALVTDCSRALDMPEGEYLFGPLDGGEPFLHRDGVGIMPDGNGLASSAQGMDHMVRTMYRMTGLPLDEVIRMATLTPARIVGWDAEIGSLEAGKRADVLLLDWELEIQQVFLEGHPAALALPTR